jgi:hypothetical protein
MNASTTATSQPTAMAAIAGWTRSNPAGSGGGAGASTLESVLGVRSAIWTKRSRWIGWVARAIMFESGVGPTAAKTLSVL